MVLKFNHWISSWLVFKDLWDLAPLPNPPSIWWLQSNSTTIKIELKLNSTSTDISGQDESVVSTYVAIECQYMNFALEHLYQAPMFLLFLFCFVLFCHCEQKWIPGHMLLRLMLQNFVSHFDLDYCGDFPGHWNFVVTINDNIKDFYGFYDNCR